MNERFTDEEQASINFSLEEFFSLTNPSKPVALFYANGNLDIVNYVNVHPSKNWFDVVAQTIQSSTGLGYSVFPLEVDRSYAGAGDGKRYDKVKRICQPGVALYVPVCFCCPVNEIPYDFEDGKLGFIASRGHLFSSSEGTSNVLPSNRSQSSWRETKGKLAVKDLSKFMKYSERVASPNEANFYRILIDI